MTSGECEPDFVMSAKGERAMGDSEVERSFCERMMS